MKIVHTADVHLSKDHPERMEALEEIIEVCEEEEPDLLLIAGDLFDRTKDVEDLKTDLRLLFSGNDFKTLVIPGNHDNSAFRKEDYFGEDMEVLRNRPLESREFEEINLIGVPYTEKDFSELVKEIYESRKDGVTNVMMIHCTLQGSTGGFGEENEYLPVEPGQLVQTGIDYVMSGHIHSSAMRRELGDTTFLYPGSPSSISETETGRREVWILDTEKGLKTASLDSKHYVRERIEIIPGEEEEQIEKLIDKMEDNDLEKACMIVEVTGFSETPVKEIESELESSLEELGCLKIDIRTEGLESMASVTSSTIYKEFKKRLSEMDVEKPKEVEKKFLRGLSRHER